MSKTASLKGGAAGGGLGVAVHDADLHTQLVDEDDHAVGLGNAAGQLPQCLGHQPGLETHEGVAHFALDLLPGRQRGDGVHHHHVHGAGADQGVGDFQGLLAGVRLGDQHTVDVHADGRGIVRVQGVFSVHEGHLAAAFLGLGHDMEGQGGLTGGLRAVDLDDPPLGHAADAQRSVQRQGAGGDGIHLHFRLVAQAHHSALAEVLLDLGDGRLQGLLLVARRSGAVKSGLFLLHVNPFLSFVPEWPG